MAARSSGPSRELAAAERFCRRLALEHYENFIVASVLLPGSMRQAFYNVYAYCRWADDLADLSATPTVARERLLDWRRQLSACFAGQSEHPIFVALGDMIPRFALRQQPFDELLDAFLQDQSKTRYQNFDELLDYCRRSADPVGRIVLRLADSDTDADNLKLSDSICTGLQLCNHWQDVARDFQIGRVYLPLQDAERFGVDVEQIGSDRQREAFCQLLRFECTRAEQLLRCGITLANRVPSWLAKDLRLMVHGGFATLDAIARINYDVLKMRPRVSRLRQIGLMTAAALGRLD